MEVKHLVCVKFFLKQNRNLLDLVTLDKKLQMGAISVNSGRALSSSLTPIPSFSKNSLVTQYLSYTWV